MDIKLKHTINPVNAVGTGVLLLGLEASCHAAVIINEIDYDQPGSDTAEFIELFNPDINPVTLDGYSLVLVNGSNGSSYSAFDLAGLTMPAKGYLVVCGDTQAVANCTIDVSTGGWIQNGGSAGDAIALLLGNMLVDSAAYENIGSFLGQYGEGNSFTLPDSNSITMSVARLPNGTDTNINASDFNSACITPGSANISGSGDCSVSLNPVPVPAAMWLFGSGLIGLMGIGRRKAAA